MIKFLRYPKKNKQIKWKKGNNHYAFCLMSKSTIYDLFLSQTRWWWDEMEQRKDREAMACNPMEWKDLACSLPRYDHYPFCHAFSFIIIIIIIISFFSFFLFVHFLFLGCWFLLKKYATKHPQSSAF